MDISARLQERDKALVKLKEMMRQDKTKCGPLYKKIAVIEERIYSELKKEQENTAWKFGVNALISYRRAGEVTNVIRLYRELKKENIPISQRARRDLNFYLCLHKLRDKLNYCDLSKLYMRHIDLSNADLAGARFGDASLTLVMLQNAILRGADLYRVRLRGVNLRGSNLIRTNMKWVRFEGVDLRKANMEGVFIRGALFRKVNLAGANLQRATIEECDFRGVRFRDCNLQGARLNNCQLDKVNMQQCRLSESRIEDVSFQQADLSGSVWNGAQCINVDLTNTILDGTSFNRAIFSAATRSPVLRSQPISRNDLHTE